MEAVVDGVTLFYQPLGSAEKYPLIILHGGPGLDHTMLRPWLDSLADRFYLIYVDQRGQGRSQRVDPATITLQRLAADVTALAGALGFESFALLGHSYGAMVSVVHAVELGDASHYVIVEGTASFAKSGPEIQHNLATFEPVELREQVTQSWALEPEAQTQEDVARIMEMQIPFHFASVESEGYRRFLAHDAHPVYSPEVLAYTAANQYEMEYEDRLGSVTKPTLIVVGEQDRTTTPRAARDLHAGIPNSELVVIPDAGHMSFIEQPDVFFPAVRDFFDRHPVGG